MRSNGPTYRENVRNLWRRTSLAGGCVALAAAAVAGVASTGWTTLGAASTPTVPPAAEVTAEPRVTEASVPVAAPVFVPAAVPAARLKPGEKPPQFVVVSFDGGGGLDSWEYWRDLARRADAGLTFFLTGTYLLPESKASLYDPPGHNRGTSEVGFSKDESVRPRMEQVRAAYLAGHEIGTHYNGHFCGPNGVQKWSAADWASELDQFNSFLTDWRANSGSLDAEPMPFGVDAIVGERTPCLEGKRDALLPVLAERGFRYDTSGDGHLEWPTQRASGLWDIPLQKLRLAGDGEWVLSMDYNFYDAQSNAAPAPASRHDALRNQTVSTYRNAYTALRDGSRAPLIIGSHFSKWNNGIYRDALGEFLLATCDNPETKCVTFTQLIDWMEAQTPETLTELQSRPVQRMPF